MVKNANFRGLSGIWVFLAPLPRWQWGGKAHAFQLRMLVLREIILNWFQGRFSVELSLMNYPYQQICGNKLFQGSTSLTLALKIGLRYKMVRVALNLFPGYSLGGIAWAHSGFWSHFVLAVKLPMGGISSFHYVVNVPVKMKDWYKTYILGTFSFLMCNFVIFRRKKKWQQSLVYNRTSSKINWGGYFLNKSQYIYHSKFTYFFDLMRLDLRCRVNTKVLERDNRQVNFTFFWFQQRGQKRPLLAGKLTL